MRRLLLAMLLLGTPAMALAQGLPAEVEPDRAPADPHAGHGAHDGHSGHEASGDTTQTPDTPLPPFIPVPTDEDRRAAFPDVHGHAVHDQAINYFVLFDQVEWQAGDGGGAFHAGATGWIGQDIDRVWFRAEGASDGSAFDHGEAHVLYGRAVARWWDVVAGVRHDTGPGPDRTWAAVGIQGLAPYWFEVEATAYVGSSGRTHFRVETEYDLLLTNRLVLQPVLEVDFHGKADPARGIGAGLSSTDLGLRLRYVVRREFSPYVGVTWERTFFGTADMARAAGKKTSGARVAFGVRVWL